MDTLAKLGGQSPQFDSFLFAPVGEDRNGTLVSVLSTLARFGVDPWKEAEALAALPRTAAADRLEKMILALADGPSAHADHQSIVSRLIALLPRAGSMRTIVGTAAVPVSDQRQQGMLWAVVMVIFLFGQAMVVQTISDDAGDDTPLTEPGNLTP